MAKSWKCTVCGIVDGAEWPPVHCEECGARDTMFVASTEEPRGIAHNPLQPHDERDQIALDFGPGDCVVND